MFLLSSTVFAQTSSETLIVDGNYFCEENDTYGVHFKVNFSTVDQVQLLTITQLIPYGGYVCDWFCDDMTANEVPYVLPFQANRTWSDGSGKVTTNYLRISSSGAKQRVSLTVSANSLRAIFSRWIDTSFAMIVTDCSLIP